MPVPMAVAPRFTSVSSARASFRRGSSSPIITAKAINSWPSVIGTASCSWVRPIFSTSANSAALASKAWRSAAISLSSSPMPIQAARRSAVG